MMAVPEGYEFITDRYYQLSMQHKLGPRDEKEMDSILEMATRDRRLEFLLNEVDHMVAHDLDLIDPDYIQAQQNDLEKRLVLKKCSEQVSEHIQDKLRGFGLYEGAVDGYYGKETKQSLRFATKKVQKLLKQEKIYGGGINGHCDWELAKAISCYRANLNKNHLSSKENDFLELSRVVCTQIPAFPDPEPSTKKTTQGLNPKTNQRPTQPYPKFKWHPALVYLGIGVSLMGLISALTTGPSQPSFVSQGNSLQPYSPSSKIQNTAYKEEDNNQNFLDPTYHSNTSLYLNQYQSESDKVSTPLNGAVEQTFPKTHNLTENLVYSSRKPWKKKKKNLSKNVNSRNNTAKCKSMKGQSHKMRSIC